MPIKRYFFIIYSLLLSINGYAQHIPEKGMPFVQNYLPEDYGNHGKIWEIKSAENGLIYMASENGLLEFDGQNWSQKKSYKGYSRSLHVQNDSTIYQGVDMEFGIWKKNKHKDWKFTPLYPYKNKTGGTTEEFWGSYALNNKIVFVSHQNLYIYQDKKVKKITAPVRFSDSFFVSGQLYLADEKMGLYVLKNEHLQQIFSYPKKKELDITGIFQEKNGLKIITKDQGILAFSNHQLKNFNAEIQPEIIKNKVFSFINIENKYWVFGTILNGVYITDIQGKIIQHLNKNKGLPNNTVLSLHYQNNGKLWLGLDYGISVIDLNDTFTYFPNNYGDYGTGYTALLSGDQFFLGTNQGLYLSGWKQLSDIHHQKSFEIIKNTEGQVWTLKNIENQLLCGHDKGLYLIENNTAKKLYNEPGISCLLRYGKYLLAGSYNGILVFDKNNNTWQFLKKIKHIVGAITQLETDKNQTLWAHLPNYGILKFDLNQNLEPTNRTLFSIEQFKGISPFLYKEKNTIHVVTNKSNAVYFHDKNKFIAKIYPEKLLSLKNKITGFYLPIKLDDSYNFYGINNGFALENKQNKSLKKNNPSQLLVRKSEAFNNFENQTIFEGKTIEYALNNVRFSYILPNENNTKYRYILDGFAQQWSNWSDHNRAEFLNLKEGKYLLKIQAKDQFGNEKELNFAFHITAPWYRTWWCYLAYLLLFILVLYSIRNYKEARLKKQKLELLKKEQKSLQALSEKHQKEILVQKQKKLEEEQENLRNQIKNKTIELATKAKEEDDKNRLLQSLKQKIDEAETKPAIANIKWKEMRKLLESSLEKTDDTFAIQMDELHQEFFKKMKQHYPQLSTYDLRLCAYLKIGLNTKEIADIMHVLASSINVSRSRLRKKLHLDPDADLYDFLNEI